MTSRLRPGWLVALFAAILAISTWLPWLKGKDKGGWVSAIGGAHGSLEPPHGFGAGQLIVLLASALIVAGALVGRGLSLRGASVAALIISLLIIGLTVLYYKSNVNPPTISVDYGMYVGVVSAALAAVCSLWAVAAALFGGRSGP
ncbi:hypothetical protein [Mycobacterium bourgelatii]|uniref:Transmembrane protein n=1 Tax=Mycobacterium bourgelatii TaxID=1273442 RepID=A0A7I9YVT1_MYCBU|nr:hypothetical protein [Mycobacterium bourgelatii]MCV6976295.1 hypothetical protein [Mycobacterium bourgelatii]GFG92686.1 hypothetical protein MBOU_47280 [Mycobacterium bourgelatii]